MDVSKNQGKLIEGVKHQYQKMKQSNIDITQNINKNVLTITNSSNDMKSVQDSNINFNANLYSWKIKN